jgi:hypothetical protein
MKIPNKDTITQYINNDYFNEEKFIKLINIHVDLLFIHFVNYFYKCIYKNN